MGLLEALELHLHPELPQVTLPLGEPDVVLIIVVAYALVPVLDLHRGHLCVGYVTRIALLRLLRGCSGSLPGGAWRFAEVDAGAHSVLGVVHPLIALYAEVLKL